MGATGRRTRPVSAIAQERARATGPGDRNGRYRPDDSTTRADDRRGPRADRLSVCWPDRRSGRRRAAVRLADRLPYGGNESAGVAHSTGCGQLVDSLGTGGLQVRRCVGRRVVCGQRVAESLAPDAPGVFGVAARRIERHPRAGDAHTAGASVHSPDRLHPLRAWVAKRYPAVRRIHRPEVLHDGLLGGRPDPWPGPGSAGRGSSRRTPSTQQGRHRAEGELKPPIPPAATRSSRVSPG